MKQANVIPRKIFVLKKKDKQKRKQQRFPRGKQEEILKDIGLVHIKLVTFAIALISVASQDITKRNTTTCDRNIQEKPLVCQ